MIKLSFPNAKIIIIDDQEINIEILKGFLKTRGFTNIESTTDSRCALSLYESSKPDLIILDLMMPNLNGYQVMDQLMRIIPPASYVPILVLTADDTTQARQKALAEGATDFLSKPFDLIEVGLRINNLLFTRKLFLRLQRENINLEETIKGIVGELELKKIDILIAEQKIDETTALLNKNRKSE